MLSKREDREVLLDAAVSASDDWLLLSYLVLVVDTQPILCLYFEDLNYILIILFNIDGD